MNVNSCHIGEQFYFILLPGFCVNDRDHDVRLLVEAIRLPSDLDGAGRKVGEATFAIYPRTNAEPRMDERAPVGKHMYKTQQPHVSGRVHVYSGA